MTERDVERLRRAVYETLAAEGRAPSVAELARRLDVDGAAVTGGLRVLARRHALVLSADGDAVRMAHPFSAAPMGFVVSPADGRDHRRWWGGCGWDSFGIVAALGVDALIDTACPACGRQHRVAAGPERPPRPSLPVHFMVPAARWWDDVVHTCSHIRMFCSEDHCREWCAAAGVAVGEVVDAERVWRLARGWYGDRLAPDYRPHTTAANQRLLAAQGLAGEFWELPS
jgi:hypothetical protein